MHGISGIVGLDIEAAVTCTLAKGGIVPCVAADGTRISGAGIGKGVIGKGAQVSG